jgi:transposase-like protein
MDRRKFTREFKLEAVRLIKDRGVSYVQASQDLNVHTSQLRAASLDHLVGAGEQRRRHVEPIRGVLVFMGQVRLDSPAPINTYTPVASRQASYGDQTSQTP